MLYKGYSLSVRFRSITTDRPITISSLVLTQDYRGAKQVGIKSFWLNRFQPVGIAENQLPNLSSLR